MKLHQHQQGSMLTVVLWPQASKDFPKWLRATKKDLNWSYMASKHLGTRVNKFPLKNVPNVFETNEDEINKNKCLWILCNVFSYYIKEMFVGPVKMLQGQKILGVTGPMGPVSV